MIRVLFICMGNICRSPTAHGVFRQLVLEKGLQSEIGVDSAGTHAYHVGRQPDGRSMETALKRGIDIRDLVARRVEASDYEEFDYLLVMDKDNFSIVNYEAPERYRSKVKYLLDYATKCAFKEVPDPYYGEGNGFERVIDMIEDACNGLLIEIKEKERLS
ncbi:MAG: phosphotyrosine protein phosphatase [Cycloclasticus sp. symbiont of Poecilosclerida sp. M]|nr:MAG: phosphotyrosine protein phosphatase [Cycloclasticus sp. symbiont of Poecilosclerida sp. M]